MELVRQVLKRVSGFPVQPDRFLVRCPTSLILCFWSSCRRLRPSSRAQAQGTVSALQVRLCTQWL